MRLALLRVTRLYLLAAVVGTAAATELPVPRAPLASAALETLVDQLRHEHPTARLQFAAVTLELLARLYRDEIASSHTRPSDDPAAVARWREAARAEVARLERLAGQLPATPDVILVDGPAGMLRIVIGTESVLLDAPRVGGARHLDVRLLERYCAAVSCPATTTSAPPALPRVWASWSFGGHAPPLLDTSSGLGFRFADTVRLRSRQEAALELVAALERAVHELRWYRERGLSIDWEAFHLARLPAGDRAVLVVNAQGEYLPLELAWREVPRAPLARWFAARLHGGTAHEIFENAESVLDAAGPAPAS